MSSVSVNLCQSYEESDVDKSLSKLFQNLGYPKVNPLSKIISKGDQVFIKPNWVTHIYRESCKYQDDLYSSITHPSIIKVLVKYIDQALDGTGKIIIGDNPSIDANFDILQEKLGLELLKSQISSEIEIIDLRPLWCDNLKYYGIKEKMVELPGDPKGHEVINLGKSSFFYGINPKRFRGVFTDRRETIAHHSGEIQEYAISKSILDSDVYISIPKLKSHHKVGATLNLKGLVGTVAIKNYLVHWRQGFPAIGGDEYPSFFSWFSGLFSSIKKRGAWEGNDTCWRMAADLYQIFSEKFKNKKTFSIIDGIMAGEGNGPFCSKSKKCNLLIGGEDMVATDLVAVRLMNFNYNQIRYLREFVDSDMNYKIISDLSLLKSDSFFGSNNKFFDFLEPTGWPNLKL